MPPGGWNGNGQSYGWLTHLGVDYGTKKGEGIYAPWGGTVSYKSGVLGYGNEIILTLENGYKIIFGHVAAGPSGLTGTGRDAGASVAVAAGAQIGVTGADVGSSRGAVTLLETLDPKGNHVNPHSLFDQVFAGTGDPFPGVTSSTQPGGNPFDNIGNALNALAQGEASLAKSGADQASAITNLPAGITAGIKSLLPTQQHVWTAFFVGLGLVMITVGLIIYFKGDDLVQAASQAPGEAVKAGEVAAVAA
jgi:hypothetical protein